MEKKEKKLLNSFWENELLKKKFPFDPMLIF